MANDQTHELLTKHGFERTHLDSGTAHYRKGTSKVTVGIGGHWTHHGDQRTTSGRQFKSLKYMIKTKYEEVSNG